MSKKIVPLNLVNTSNFDLNLLTIFCMIYNSRNISHVADLLNVSASAVSQSLSKLRLQFKDYLFIRKGRQLQPTVYADELYKRISNSLNIISESIPSGNLSPERKTLVIHTSLSLSSMIVPALYQHLLFTGADFSLHHNECGMNDQIIKELLIHRQTDLVFSTTAVQSSEIASEKFFTTNLMLVCSENNSRYKDRITIEEFLNADVISYTAVSDKMLHYRHSMERKYRSPKKRLLTSSMTTFLTSLACTESIGIIPSRFMPYLTAHFRLREIVSPFDFPELIIYLSYRKELRDETMVFQLLDNVKQLLNTP